MSRAYARAPEARAHTEGDRARYRTIPVSDSKNAGGRPSGQFAYNRNVLLEFLKVAPAPCQLTNEELAEKMSALVAGHGTFTSPRQVRRWLKALVDRGSIRVIEMHYRVRGGGNDGRWNNVRKIQVLEEKGE